MADKNDRNDRNDMNDNRDRSGITDISDITDRIAEIARIAKGDKNIKSDDKNIKSYKNDKSSVAAANEEAGDKSCGVVGSGKSGESEKFGESDKSEKTGNPEKVEKSGESDITDRIAEIARIAKGDKNIKSDKNDKNAKSSVAAADEEAGDKSCGIVGSGKSGGSEKFGEYDGNRYKRVGRSGSRTRGTLVSVLVLVLLVSFAAAAYVLTEKEIELVDNGNSVFVKTHAATVADLLEQQEIVLGEEDEVSPTAETEIADGDSVSVHRAFAVSVSADFKTESFLTQPVTVAEFLEKNGVEVGEYDWVSPGKDSVVTPETSVVINRITYRQTQTTEEIKPKKVRRNDSTLNVGQSKIVTEGVSGERLITNLVTYKDGVPIAKQELSRVVAKAAQDEVLAVGTRKVISRGGKEYVYTDVYTMKATAYTHTGNKTASGTWPSPGFTVAVDPDFIPLGTMLYVDGYGYAKAEDTGGRISGKRIDIFLNTEKECLNWGVRNVRVYILD